MNEFFDNLGSAARRAAGKVNTQVAIAAQEQKVQDAYKTLGRLCYQAVKNCSTPQGAEFEAAIARVDGALARIQELRNRADVDPTTATDADFVD